MKFATEGDRPSIANWQSQIANDFALIRRTMRRRTIALLVGVLCAVSAAKADEVIFKNGDRITGKIDVYDGTKLVMKSGPAAKVEIDLKTVKTFSTDGP